MVKYFWTDYEVSDASAATCQGAGSHDAELVPGLASSPLLVQVSRSAASVATLRQVSIRAARHSVLGRTLGIAADSLNFLWNEVWARHAVCWH